MVVNERSLKRMKRRVTADLQDLLTFPSSDSVGLEGGPFRKNVREFLKKHALVPPPSSLFPHLMTWQVLFRVGDLMEGPDSTPVVVGLDVVEESVARSRSVYCDHCRVVGWSGHPVCVKRYHFIVKADGFSISGQAKPCTKCGYEVHFSEPRCKLCSHVMTSEDLEDWVYRQLEDTSHLLHGVIHANGYGHLLRVNGREGGSRVLSGFHIMDLWDRLCKYLGVRKISVMDVSKKYGLEYRLVHAVIKGHPWYGDWGYEFGAGSFALTLATYRDAIETLSSLPLSSFLCQGRKPRTRVQDLILFYQSLSEHELVNIRDLFCFVMSLIHDAPKISLVLDQSNKKLRSCPSGVLSAWTSSDINRVNEAMIRVLRAVSVSNWVSWRTLRGAVSKVGPPELLDYCLRELAGKQAVNGMVVQVRCNPHSGALEYRLESGNASLHGGLSSSDSFVNNCPSKDHLIRDLRYLYESLLHPQTMMRFGPDVKRDFAVSAAMKLLDCKQFVKDYKPETALPDGKISAIYLFCRVELLDQSEEYVTNPPPELVVLAQNASVSDLKAEASRAFQEVYVIFKGFQGEELLDYGGVDESTPIKLLLKSFDTVSIRGRWLVKNGLGRFRMERGIERWTVDCSCGAKDDDGERMLACDVCGVWQHTRCAGIHDSDAVPARFVCGRCRISSNVEKISAHGKEKSVASAGAAACGGGGKSLAMPLDVL
ncbi:hypothetical protein Nepgr_001717 [Nepenthes gracilis]|uniref:Zinc finger PHD-type domain-containing protein n=1 Tax=Nepenthes gracilis TaxID=150966 RepID=A0AAD3P5K9_NEPGR|nr:hypothetical protein Nepgr_001717 [Nepenthes gracilis]